MNAAQRRLRILQNFEIDLVLDVGANAGQFATDLRQSGYGGRIVSFEPMSAAFQTLDARASDDPLWSCVNAALGEEDGSASIHVSENSFSSSLLEACDWSLDVEASIRSVSDEQVQVRRLDGLFDEIVRPGERVFMKVDTQGFEIPVIRGALGALKRLPLVQLEVSFRPVYVNEAPAHHVMALMAGLGYRVVLVDEGWEDPVTAEVLQADILFAA